MEDIGWDDRSNYPAGKTGQTLSSCKMQMQVWSHFDILGFFLNKDNLIFSVTDLSNDSFSFIFCKSLFTTLVINIETAIISHLLLWMFHILF